MDSETETNTDTQSSFESLLFSKDGSYKSPESSDCEGYATPLASSLDDIATATNHGIIIDLPESGDEPKDISSGELTPVSTTRAASPPVVRHVIHLEKPKFLVMTQRELTDEECNVQKADTDSEEEFFDVAADPDVHIRDVAQQLFDAVREPEVAETTLIVASDIEGSEQCNADDVIVEENPEENEGTDDSLTVAEVTEFIVSQLSEINPNDVAPAEEEVSLQSDTLEACQDLAQNEQADQQSTGSTVSICDSTVEVTTITAIKELVDDVTEVLIPENHAVELSEDSQITETRDAAAMTPDIASEATVPLENSIVLEIITSEDNQEVVVETPVESGTAIVEIGTPEATLQVDEPEAVQTTEISTVAEKTDTEVSSDDTKPLVEVAPESDLDIVQLDVAVSNIPVVNVADEPRTEGTAQTVNSQSEGVDESGSIANLQQHNPVSTPEISEEIQEVASIVFLPEDAGMDVEPVKVTNEVDEEVQKVSFELLLPSDSGIQVEKNIQSVEDVQEVSLDVSFPETTNVEEKQFTTSTPDDVHIAEQLETSDVVNPETIVEETMPTLVISDEVKTSQTTTTTREDDFYTDCSTRHEVKVDFDGYSSGREESLSSSTSSESFEFAETVPSQNDDERTQALRNSIIERYPSNETDDDDLDSVGDECDEDLLAVKQISAEVEQLVAAINAFGRDEEQQMSAYMVGKKMADGQRKKSAMEASAASSSPCQDQLVQSMFGAFLAEKKPRRQTDTDLILVERNLPEVMESLQSEIERLQADLDKVRIDEKELLKINAKLQEDLNESQQTIDGIEVEAEQQYTELTSEIDELCDIVLKKDQELAGLKEKVANLSVSELNLKEDIDGQKSIVQRQKAIIEGLREELDAITKKLAETTKHRDKAVEEATIYKMKNMERERFLSREAQMSMEIEDLQRELNKQKLILNQTSMAKLADTFDRKVLHLENELRERDMLICKQNQIINSHRKSPTGSVITTRKMQPRASVLAAAGNLPSAGSSSESFQNGLDADAKEALLSFILSDRHNQLANIYNIGRILDLTAQEERAVERHLTKDRFA